MKKSVSLLLCLLMVLAVFSGCGPATEPTESTPETTEGPKQSQVLSVGFGKVDVTPTESVPMNGLGTPTDRMSKDVRDPLYLSCTAFTDEFDNTVIMFAVESLYTYDLMRFAAKDIEKETGVPYANIMFGSNHSHSSPSLPSDEVPSIQRYSEMLREKILECAKIALADRKPAKMYLTTAYPEGINFIRHYVMSDGTYAGDNFGKTSGKTYVKHVRDVDNSLQLVKFVREGGKDIIMMNWQGHPTGHSDYRYSILSYYGRVTSAVEEALDCHCQFILGASANVNNNSRIKEENAFTGYEEKAAGLAQYVIRATGYEEAQVGNVQLVGLAVPCTPKSGGNNKVDIYLNAFSIGDLALVTAPYEMYCENGEAVKEASPFKMTFVSSCSNGRGSYIPSISTYDYNNMPDEVYGINMTAYAPGTAELLVEGFGTMLNELYQTK